MFCFCGGRVARVAASQSGVAVSIPGPRHTEVVKNGTGCFLVRRSALKGKCKDWLVRCQDNSFDCANPDLSGLAGKQLRLTNLYYFYIAY